MKYITHIKWMVIGCLLFSTTGISQSALGIYRLTGEMETAGGIKLNADSSFEFYFSYGALDRYASGIWFQSGDSIFLNSKPWPGKDFRLVNTSVRPGKRMVLELAEKNTMVLPFVYFTWFKNGKKTTLKTDSHGMASADIYAPDSIGVQFEFTPERISVFKPAKTANNYYSFAFEKWVTELFFTRTSFLVNHDQLKGRLSMLREKEFVFVKEN